MFIKIVHALTTKEQQDKCYILKSSEDWGEAAREARMSMHKKLKPFWLRQEPKESRCRSSVRASVRDIPQMSTLGTVHI